MKKVGIWIDKKMAKIVSIEGQQENIETLTSGIESFRAKGGSGTKLKGGPQDVVQDSKYLEREKHQIAAFVKDIVPKIKNANTIVILGPAQMGMKLKDELSKKHGPLHEKVVAVEKADNMTDNQLIAWVRNY